MTFEEKVELFFFDHVRDRDDYIDEYKRLNPGRVSREGGKYRYSPLFLIRKDIDYCFAFGRELNPCRNNIHPAEFAGFVLINTCFTSLLKKYYYGNFLTFARDWMGIANQSELDALRYLRNGLMHNFYGLYFYDNNRGVKVYFSLGPYPNIIRKSGSRTSPYPSETYEVNHRQLFIEFNRAIGSLKNKLLDPTETKLRSNFNSNFDLDTWMVTGP